MLRTLNFFTFPPPATMEWSLYCSVWFYRMVPQKSGLLILWIGTWNWCLIVSLILTGIVTIMLFEKERSLNHLHYVWYFLSKYRPCFWNIKWNHIKQALSSVHVCTIMILPWETATHGACMSYRLLIKAYRLRPSCFIFKNRMDIARCTRPLPQSSSMLDSCTTHFHFHIYFVWINNDDLIFFQLQSQLNSTISIDNRALFGHNIMLIFGILSVKTIVLF